MAAEALVALVFLGALVFPFVLYVLVQREREDRREMDRDAAERLARRDTRDEAGAGLRENRGRDDWRVDDRTFDDRTSAERTTDDRVEDDRVEDDDR